MVLSTSLQKPMFELWASIKQKNFLFIPAHKQQIFQTATKEIKLMHWDTSDAVNGKKMVRNQVMVYRQKTRPNSSNKI